MRGCKGPGTGRSGKEWGEVRERTKEEILGGVVTIKDHLRGSVKTYTVEAS